MPHFDAVALESLNQAAGCGFDFVVRDDVQTVAKQRHAPAIHLRLQQVGRLLRLIDTEFYQVPALLALDATRSALRHDFTSYHEAEPVALLSFFEIVRSDQDCR